MNAYENLIAEIKSSKLPTIIYGAGTLASMIQEYLSSHNLDFDGYSVDKEYHTNTTKCGKPVYALEDYINEHPCNVILGIMGISQEKEAAIRSHPNVNAVLSADFPGRFPLGMDSDCGFTQEYLDANKEAIEELRSQLCDEESKLQLDLFISQRTNGNYRKTYSVAPQYFEKDVIQPCDNEVFVDCGAYDGDTIKAFTEYLDNKKYNKIFAFEADTNNVEKMKTNLASMQDTVIVPKGVYDHSTTLHFSNDGKTSSRISDSGITLEVTAIDDCIGNEDVTFIKMDIEGCELKALQGAAATIRRCKPKLAICVYHRKEDILTIPQYIKSLDPTYKLYFRNYHAQSTESVIYAI